MKLSEHRTKDLEENHECGMFKSSARRSRDHVKREYQPEQSRLSFKNKDLADFQPN